MSEATIEVNGLCKRFGPALAPDGMSLTPRPGQGGGFAGPNVVSNSYLARHIRQVGPMTAGLAIQAATGVRNLPHQPMGRAAELSC